jgi:hypothetical protein
MSSPQDSGDRRPSIVERASAVIEAAKMRKSSLLSNVGFSQNSLGLVKDGEEVFSMNPDDYELKQVIGTQFRLILQAEDHQQPFIWLFTSLHKS